MRSPQAIFHDLIRVLDGNAERRNPREVLEAFVRLSACACAYGLREDQYRLEADRWDSRELERFKEAFALMVEHIEADAFRDVLGPLYMEVGSRSSQKWGGEFYTPRDVCLMMARMTIGTQDLPTDRPITFLEPASGSGAMVLACAETLVEQGFSPLNMIATCVDISPIAADMCFINLTLNSIPGTVVHGNSLTLESWGAWRTVVYPFAHPIKQLDAAAALQLLHTAPPPPQPVLKAEQEHILRAAAKAQPGLFDELEEVPA